MSVPAAGQRPAVAAAVVVHGGRVLLVRRRVAEAGLSWQFPAGQIKPGESAAQAAVRETYEEAGLTVTAEQDLGQRVHPATGRTILYVACTVVAGIAYAADQDEVAEIAWCDYRTFRDRVPHPLLGRVHDYLRVTMT